MRACCCASSFLCVVGDGIGTAGGGCGVGTEERQQESKERRGMGKK